MIHFYSFLVLLIIYYYHYTSYKTVTAAQTPDRLFRLHLAGVKVNVFVDLVIKQLKIVLLYIYI